MPIEHFHQQMESKSYIFYNERKQVVNYAITNTHTHIYKEFIKSLFSDKNNKRVEDPTYCPDTHYINKNC